MQHLHNLKDKHVFKTSRLMFWEIACTCQFYTHTHIAIHMLLLHNQWDIQMLQSY